MPDTPPSSSRSPSDRLWLGLLCLLAILFFWPVLFGGQSFYFRDVSGFNYPQAVMTLDALGEGRLPHWDPRIGAGYPHQSDPTSAAFYPLTWLMLLMPLPRGYDVFVVAHVLLGGAFMYLLLRRWGTRELPAALGAFVMMFCGYGVSLTNLSAYQRGFVWAPAALLAFESYLSGGGRRALAMTALVLAVQRSAADPQFVMLTGLLLVLAPWLRPLGLEVSRARAVGGALLAGGFAFLLLSAQYVPLARLAALSDRKILTREELGTYNVDPANLMHALVPVPFPEQANPFYKASFHGGRVPVYLDLYLGPLILSLALAALSLGASAIRLGGLACWSLLMALGHATPLFELTIALCPPLAMFRFPGKYLMPFSIAIPILVALGLDAVLRGDARPRRLLLFGLAAWAGLGAIGWSALQLTGTRYAELFLQGAFEGMPEAEAVPETLTAAWRASLAFGIGLAVAGLTLGALLERRRPEWRAMGRIVALLAAIDLWQSTAHSYPFTEDAALAEPPPSAQKMERAARGQPPTRYVYFAPNIYVPHALSWTGLQQFYLERELLMNFRGAPFGLAHLLDGVSLRQPAESELWNLMSVGPEAQRDRLAAAAGARYGVHSRKFSEGYPVEVKEYATRSPRAFIAERAIGDPDAKKSSAVTLAGFPIEARYLGEARMLAPRTVRRCDIRDYRANGFDVDFELEGEGLLVVLDAFHPDWRATVDGASRPIVPVARIFRGVEVRGGEKRLRMEIDPWPFRLGAVISVMAALGLLFWSRQRR